MDETMQATQPPERESGPAKGVTLHRPVIVALLYLLNIFLGFSVFVGLVLAYVWRSDAETQEWERTHYSYLIRTFWIGFALCVGTFVVWMTMFFGMALNEAGESEPPRPRFFMTFFGGMVLWLLAAIWFITRSILSLVRAGNCRPMPNPRTWLF